MYHTNILCNFAKFHFWRLFYLDQSLQASQRFTSYVRITVHDNLNLWDWFAYCSLSFVNRKRHNAAQRQERILYVFIYGYGFCTNILYLSELVAERLVVFWIVFLIVFERWTTSNTYCRTTRYTYTGMYVSTILTTLMITLTIISHQAHEKSEIRNLPALIKRPAAAYLALSVAAIESH